MFSSAFLHSVRAKSSIKYSSVRHTDAWQLLKAIRILKFQRKSKRDQKKPYQIICFENKIAAAVQEIFFIHNRHFHFCLHSVVCVIKSFFVHEGKKNGRNQVFRLIFQRNLQSKVFGVTYFKE